MIGLAVAHRTAVAMAAAGVVLMAGVAWRRLPLEPFPDVRLPELYVQAWWRGASPEAVEALVTSRLEAETRLVRGAAEVESISSDESGYGLSLVTVRFARGTRMRFARLELAERLAALRTGLPAGVRGPHVAQYVPPRLLPRETSFLRYAVSGPVETTRLRALVEDVIAPALGRVSGVAAVEIVDDSRRTLALDVDDTRSRSLHVAGGELPRALGALSLSRGAGALTDRGLRRALVVRTPPPTTTAELTRAELSGARRRLLRVRDVAAVRDTADDFDRRYRVDGHPAIRLDVRRADGTNATAVASRARARIAELGVQLPAGVRVSLEADESEALGRRWGELGARAVVACAVVCVVLAMSLRSVGLAAAAFATVTIALALALAGLHAAGLRLNALTLTGLALSLGPVADTAIVITDAARRHARRGSPLAGAVEGAREVLLPVAAGAATLIAALVPLVYLQGELRAVYFPLAAVVALALVSSLAVSFTVLPAMLASAPMSRRARRRNVVTKVYGALLARVLDRPRLAASVGAAAFAASTALFARYVDRDAEWRLRSAAPSELEVTIRTPRGAGAARADQVARAFEGVARGLPGVERFSVDVHESVARVRVRTSGGVAAARARLESFAHLFGGAEIAVAGAGAAPAVDGAVPAYAFAVLGYDYDRVEELANDLAGRLRRFARVRDVDANASPDGRTDARVTELALRLDRPALAVHRVRAAEVVRRARIAAGGGAAGAIRMAGSEVPLRIRLAGPTPVDAPRLLDLPVASEDGGDVRLGAVGRLVERETPARIVRVGQRYRRVVTYDYLGPQGMGDKVYRALLRSARLPAGYGLEPLGDVASVEERSGTLWMALAAALLLTYMVTAALFESLRQPLCVMLTVPMAMVGVVVTFLFADASFPREGWLPVVVTSGMVASSAILLVNRANRLRRTRALAARAAALHAALDRAPAVVMTSSSAVLGLLPCVLAGAGPKADVWSALGCVLLGGLAGSAVMVLTITPALYSLLEGRGRATPPAPRPGACT